MEYLVKDFGFDSEIGYPTPTLQLVGESEIFEVLNEAREKHKLISVYRIGNCVLDWS